MGLTSDYHAFLSEEDRKRTAENREKSFQSQMPSEFQFSVVPLTLTDQVSGLVSEFIDLVPSECWKSFPINGPSPTSSGYELYARWELDNCRRISSRYDCLWFLQILWPDETRRMVPVRIRHYQCYYYQIDVNRFHKAYGEPEMEGIFRRREREYSEQEALEDAKRQENAWFCNETSNARIAVNKLANRITQGMSQDFVCLHDIQSEYYSSQYYYIIFRDGFVYECYYFDKFEQISSDKHSHYSAFRNYGRVKDLFLHWLKRNSESTTRDTASSGHLICLS